MGKSGWGQLNMASYDLSQSEADLLRSIEKRRVDDTEWTYPGMGGGVSIPLISTDGREQFVLDIRKGRANLAKGSYQNRARRVTVLIRLCFGGAHHVNPDGNAVGSPHLHLYREGYGDKWAYQLPSADFSDLTDQWKTFQDFLRFCNIVEPPYIKQGLSA